MTSKDEIRVFVVGPIETNCYAYISEGKCLVIDAGASGARIAEALADYDICAVVATHGHHDHVCGVSAFKRATQAPFYAPQKDAWRLTQALELSASAFALPSNPEEENAPEPDKCLSEGDVIELGSARFKVIETPGHTEGGICLVGEGSAEGIVFVGDTLFKGSCGRTDLLGGDNELLMKSLARLAKEIDPATTVLSGHGEASTMEYELATNPALIYAQSLNAS